MRAGSTASRTAVLVCQARAVADGRLAPGRFSDSTAARLLRSDEEVAVERARDDEAPQRTRDRMQWEMLRATATVMVPRTIAIDDAIRERTNCQVVILGAGLDGRAWRMSELAGASVFEVDHPASQDDKKARVATLSAVTAQLHYVPVDFSQDSLHVALADAGHDRTVPTTWIWEGVVSYLTRDEVIATLGVVGRRSAPGSRLVINYQAPSRSAALGRWFMGAVATVTRQDNPLAGEPTRSTWSASGLAEALTAHRFVVVADDDLLTLIGRLDVPVTRRASLSNGRVVVADRPVT
ncbi:MAG: putative methyltransferase [Aeromicrobium sp.]|nr:putative methyltransferase [Aeromicrobium sp.]